MYNNSGRISERERLERDADGNFRGELKNTPNDRNGGFNGSNRGSGGNGGGNGKKIIFSLAILVILVIFGLSGDGGFGFGNLVRTFNSTPEENLNAMFTSIKKAEADNERNGRPYDIYDYNNLYGDEAVQKLVDKEYVVYVYSNNEEKNQPFNEWVEENQNDVPVYRLSSEDVFSNHEVIEYLEDDTPMLLVYNEVEREKKELEGVIKDPELLGEVLPYINNIIAEKTGRNDSNNNNTEE